MCARLSLNLCGSGYILPSKLIICQFYERIWGNEKEKLVRTVASVLRRQYHALATSLLSFFFSFLVYFESFECLMSRRRQTKFKRSKNRCKNHCSIMRPLGDDYIISVGRYWDSICSHTRFMVCGQNLLIRAVADHSRRTHVTHNRRHIHGMVHTECMYYTQLCHGDLLINLWVDLFSPFAEKVSNATNDTRDMSGEWSRWCPQKVKPHYALWYLRYCPPLDLSSRTANNCAVR